MAAKNVMALSLENMANPKATISPIRYLMFFLSMYCKLNQMLNSTNTHSMISSRPLMLATTSVCMGCAVYNTVIMNGRSLLLSTNIFRNTIYKRTQANAYQITFII